MVEFISNLIGNEYIATIIMSIFPLIELKGGIVYAQSAGINPLLSLLLAYIGSTIIFIPIFFLLIPILNLLKKIKFIEKFATKIETYFSQKAETELSKQMKKSGEKRNAEFIKQVCILVFIAIPLPVTGVWTGTAIAVFLGLKFTKVIIPATIGNLIAGILILLLSLGCKLIGIPLDYVLNTLFILAVILLVFLIVKVMRVKTKDSDKTLNK